MRIWSVVGLVAVLAQTPTAVGPPAVDHHQHLFSRETGALSDRKATTSAADLVKRLDEAGIRRAVVLSAAYQFGNPNRPRVEHEYDKVKAENDWTSREVSQFRDRLVGFCGFNPLAEYALRELERCAGIEGLRRGIKLHFGNSDIQLTNAGHVEKLRRVFRAANGRRMAIVVHMRPSVTMRRAYGADEANIFLEKLMPEAPDVPVQIAHMTGAGTYDEAAVDQALSVFAKAAAAHDPRMAHVYIDVSGVAGFGKWAEEAELITLRIRQLGPERVLFGSDTVPGSDFGPREAWQAFRKLPLTDDEFRVIAANVAPYMRD